MTTTVALPIMGRVDIYERQSTGLWRKMHDHGITAGVELSAALDRNFDLEGYTSYHVYE